MELIRSANCDLRRNELYNRCKTSGRPEFREIFCMCDVDDRVPEIHLGEHLGHTCYGG